MSNQRQTNTTVKFLFVTSLLFATGTTAFQMPKVPPGQSTRAPTPNSPSQLKYTYTNEVVPEAVKTQEFQDRVKNLIKQKQPAAATTTTKPAEKKTTKPSGLPNMMSVNSKEDLKKAVLEDENRLTVVRFHAPYCQSCKRMEPMLHNFARRNPDIQFIDVAYTKEESNREVIHSLGVPSFPYCHVYHPASAGLLEEHSVNQKYFKDVASRIESYLDGGCDLPPTPNEDGIYASPYKSLMTEETR